MLAVLIEHDDFAVDTVSLGRSALPLATAAKRRVKSFRLRDQSCALRPHYDRLRGSRRASACNAIRDPRAGVRR